jgi:hypothetical protein
MSPAGSYAFDLEILTQPDDSTCGPTCLHAVYRYFKDRVELDDVIAEVPRVAGGGTLAVNLANHALRRDYRALIVTYNLNVFDPSWFAGEQHDLAERLSAQAAARGDPRLSEATQAYLEFLRLGGELTMEDLSPGLLRRWLQERKPILTGLSATFLYRSAREVGEHVLHEDDVRGVPTGHFVVLCGYDPEERMVRIADPIQDELHFSEPIYWLPVDRVINSILLGVLTYDANLLVLDPPERRD